MRSTTTPEPTRKARLRRRLRHLREARRAIKAVATNGVRSLSTHLIARGMHPDHAHRYNGAATRKANKLGLLSAGVLTRIIPTPKGPRPQDVTLYTHQQVDDLLAIYRPAKNRQNRDAIDAFDRIAGGPLRPAHALTA
ncbi:hypothetical protein [Streptomyces sp. MJM8645]|uniref:hypothetical protein n=1 Tax=Streptomycetaceae TaxID=2062 RepID=UPI0007AF6686|nr:hypothetical protein [Streptomyces sp. MJM8645]